MHVRSAPASRAGFAVRRTVRSSTEADLGVVVELGEDGFTKPRKSCFEVLCRRDRSTPDVGDRDVTDLLGGGKDVEGRGNALGSAGNGMGVDPQGGQVSGRREDVQRSGCSIKGGVVY